MSLKLSPMLEEDIDEFGVLDELVMQDWTFARLMDNSGRPRREFVSEWTRKDWGKDDKAHWLKVTDTETGEIVAISFWRLPIQNIQPATFKSEQAADAEGSIQQEAIPEADRRTKKFWAEVEETKKSFFEEFLGNRVHACKFSIQQIFQHRSHSCADLHLLITHPSHRRRGAGSMLVKWGCDKADELGIMAACTASTAGEFVYKKNGFEVRKAVEMDLSPFGADEIELRRFMVREPVIKQTE